MVLVLSVGLVYRSVGLPYTYIYVYIPKEGIEITLPLLLLKRLFLLRFSPQL